MNQLKDLTNLRLNCLLLELKSKKVFAKTELSSRLLSKEIKLLEDEIKLRLKVQFEF